LGGKGDLLLDFQSPSPLSILCEHQEIEKARRKRRKRERVTNERKRKIIIIITHFIYHSTTQQGLLILPRYNPVLTHSLYYTERKSHVFTQKQPLIMDSAKDILARYYIQNKARVWEALGM